MPFFPSPEEMTTAIRRSEPSVGCLERPFEFADLVASYEARFVTVSALLERATEALGDHRRELDELTAELRELYAARASVRKSDFDVLVRPGLSYLRELEFGIKEALADFRRKGAKSVTRLKGLVEGSSRAPVADWQAVRAEFATGEQAREAEFSRLLRDYHIELSKLRALFTVLQGKQGRLRVRDLKRLIKSLVEQQGYAKTSLGRWVRDLDELEDRIGRQWGNLIAATTAERS